MRNKFIKFLLISSVFLTVSAGQVAMASPQDTINELNSKIDTLKTELEEVNKKISTSEQELNTTIEEIDKRTKVVENVDSIIEKTQERAIKDITSLANELSTKIIESQTKSLLTGNKDLAKIDIHPLSYSILSSKETTRTEVNYENSILEETKNELNTENEALNSEKDAKTSENSAYIEQKRVLEENISNLEKEVDELNRQIEEEKILAERSARIKAQYGLDINGKNSDIVETALKYLGIPYVWGGTTPSGFDCSGLMQYVYRQHGISISRTTYTQIYDGTPVSRNELQPGDLVFPNPDHVVMYIGNGKILHAPQTGDVVKIASLGNVWKAVRIK